MKKLLPSLVLSMLLVLGAGTPVQALSIVVDEKGTTYFYQDQVLGEETKDGQKTQRLETKEAQRANPLKVLPSNTKTELKFKPKENKTEVILEKKMSPTNTREEKPRFEVQEKMEAERLQVEFPAKLKEENVQRDSAAPEMMERPQADRPSMAPEKRPDILPGAPIERGNNERPEKVRLDRQQRQTEKLEIQSQLKEDGTTELELKSRAARAKLRGAEFSVDPETNQVTITTPSGNEHVLNHLPDQALVTMEAKGLLSAEDVTSQSELKIETKEDGSVVYKTKTKKPKKVLWFFNREIENEVELNDQTGEVTEKEVPAEGVWGRFVNSLAR